MLTKYKKDWEKGEYIPDENASPVMKAAYKKFIDGETTKIYEE